MKRYIKKINAGITTSCVAGIILSYYAYIVETSKENDESYEAMCDISERVSCTKVFMSEYGKGFGIIPKTSLLYLTNSVYGLVFYTLVAVLSVSNRYSTSVLTILLGILSNLGSIYLASILYWMNDICIICVSTYIINAILLILAVAKHRKLFRNGTSEKKTD